MSMNRIALALLTVFASTSGTALAGKRGFKTERAKIKAVAAEVSLSTVPATSEAAFDSCFDEQANVDFWRDQYWAAVERVNSACGDDSESGISAAIFGADDGGGGGVTDECADALADMVDTREVYESYVIELNGCLGI